MTKTQEQSPILWAVPGTNIQEIPRDPLRVRIDVHEDTILLRNFDKGHNTVRTISADDLRGIFSAKMEITSGLMPPHTIWWNQGPNGPIAAQYRPPTVWSAALQTEVSKPPKRFSLPMPGLVFITSPGRAPWVFAAKSRPSSPDDDLYHVPTFNVFENGRVCAGSHSFPNEVEEIPDSFFLSFFSQTGHTQGRSKKHPDNLLALWEEIDGKQKYPMADLVRVHSVRKAMSITESRY